MKWAWPGTSSRKARACKNRGECPLPPEAVASAACKVAQAAGPCGKRPVLALRPPPPARSPNGRKSASLETPDARGVPLDYRRSQAKRFGCDAADPKLYAGDVNRDEYGARSIRPVRKIDVVSGLPAPTYLRLALGKAR